jgi:hypothetical protein
MISPDSLSTQILILNGGIGLSTEFIKISYSPICDRQTSEISAVEGLLQASNSDIQVSSRANFLMESVCIELSTELLRRNFRKGKVKSLLILIFWMLIADAQNRDASGCG